MLAFALGYLLNSLMGLFIGCLLIRFYLQLTRASFHHPLMQFVMSLTNFCVLPMRRVIPGLWGTDLATLVCAWMAEFILQVLLSGLGSPESIPFSVEVLPILAIFSLIKLLSISLYILIGAVIIQAVLSWVNPYSPFMDIVTRFVSPIMRPIQKIVPPIGGVDLSPLFVLMALQLILMIGIAPMEQMLLSLAMPHGLENIQLKVSR